jgi:hypothetical protein
MYGLVDAQNAAFGSVFTRESDSQKLCSPMDHSLSLILMENLAPNIPRTGTTSPCAFLTKTDSEEKEETV